MSKNYSILRKLQYDYISKFALNGEVLDLGGNSGSGYRGLIGGNHRFTTVNIDADSGCDVIFDIQKKFFFEKESYDAVICMNVLEHIFSFENVFKETARVLKKDSFFIFSTPFMCQVHGSPDDYFRYTKSALIRLSLDSGFREVDVKELNYGLFSLFFQIVGGALPISFVRIFFKNLSILIDKTLLIMSKRYGRLNSRIPLGYMVVAKK